MSTSAKSSKTLAQRVGPSAVDDVRVIRAELDKQAGHDVRTLAESARRVADEFRSRHPQLGRSNSST
jgi:hypothetical protein